MLFKIHSNIRAIFTSSVYVSFLTATCYGRYCTYRQVKTSWCLLTQKLNTARVRENNLFSYCVGKAGTILLPVSPVRRLFILVNCLSIFPSPSLPAGVHCTALL